MVRNALWFAWLRRPLPTACAATRTWWIESRRDRSLVRNFADALRGLPWVLRERRVVPSDVEHALRTIASFYTADDRRRDGRLPVSVVEHSKAG